MVGHLQCVTSSKSLFLWASVSWSAKWGYCGHCTLFEVLMWWTNRKATMQCFCTSQGHCHPMDTKDRGGAPSSPHRPTYLSTLSFPTSLSDLAPTSMEPVVLCQNNNPGWSAPTQAPGCKASKPRRASFTAAPQGSAHRGVRPAEPEEWGPFPWLCGCWVLNCQPNSIFSLYFQDHFRVLGPLLEGLHKADFRAAVQASPVLTIPHSLIHSKNRRRKSRVPTSAVLCSLCGLGWPRRTYSVRKVGITGLSLGDHVDLPKASKCFLVQRVSEPHPQWPYGCHQIFVEWWSDQRDEWINQQWSENWGKWRIKKYVNERITKICMNEYMMDE